MNLDPHIPAHILIGGCHVRRATVLHSFDLYTNHVLKTRLTLRTNLALFIGSEVRHTHILSSVDDGLCIVCVALWVGYGKN